VDHKNESISRRNRPGTKDEVRSHAAMITLEAFCPTTLLFMKDLYQWPHLPLDEIESAFALQEYLQSLIRLDRRDVDTLVKLPSGQAQEIWQYEHLRYRIFLFPLPNDC
jgi:hypothetical protein